ncbi:MAG: thiamine pyrophosphate-dependent enzyme, partial [Eggerthellaceae bacterium]|nr:thiamine pyrophosphate-dependent enzyme [Eggerthellaceae bacterium]
DLALLHDLNALNLQKEILAQSIKGRSPGIVVVVLNNKGGAIFEMLPQNSPEPYFERLFLTPQEAQFESIARGFGLPFKQVETVTEFETAYRAFCGQPGLHLIEVAIEPKKLKEFYDAFLT